MTVRPTRLLSRIIDLLASFGPRRSIRLYKDRQQSKPRWQKSRKMQNSRTFMPFAKIAQRCRLVILLLLTTGMIVSGTHRHVEDNPNSHGTSSYSELSNADSSAGVIDVVALTVSSSCPSHVSCHQHVFYGYRTDLTVLPMQGSSRRHFPGDTTVTGSSTSLVHPPPKA